MGITLASPTVGSDLQGNVDFSGTVEKSDSDEFKEGDKVILTGCRVGELFHGGYSQYAKAVSYTHLTLPTKRIV